MTNSSQKMRKNDCNKRVLYVVFEEFALALLPGQYNPLATWLNINGECYLLAIISWRYLFSFKNLKNLLNRYYGYSNDHVLWLPKLPRFIMRALLRRILLKHRINIVQARGPVATTLALSARSGSTPSVIYDCRGVQPEEWELAKGYGNANYHHKITALTKMEKQSILHSDGVLFVTKQLQDYMRQKYGREQNSAVVPCYVEEAREPIEQIAHSASSHFPIFVYSGTSAPWQCIDEVLEAFMQLKKQYKKSFLSILTPHKENVQSILQAHRLNSVKDIFIASLTREEVFTALEGANFGFLLRRQHPVNRVAFPVKFAEYLRAGTPVIISTALPACVEIVKRHDLGIIVDLEVEGWQFKLVDEIEKYQGRYRKHEDRNRIKEVAAKTLAFNVFKPVLSNFYESIHKR